MPENAKNMQFLTSKLTAIVSASSVFILVLYFLQQSLKCCKPVRDKPTNRAVTYYHTWDSPDKRSFYNYGKYITLRGGGNTHLMIAVTSSPWEGYKSGPPYLCKGTFRLPIPTVSRLHTANL